MHCRYDSPVGPLWIEEKNGLISRITNVPIPGVTGDHPVLMQAVRELTEYFAGTRRTFTVPIGPEGTDFQLKVWAALRDIPYGETRSYGAIAAAVGSPKASRAVGGANHHNPIAVIIPCHRVIGADGSLTGYGGGLDKKEFLLDLEQRFK